MVDSLVTQRKNNMGYIIFHHMKVCFIRSRFVLPYGMFITKIMKFFHVNFHGNTKIIMLKASNMYNVVCLHCMQFKLKDDGTWGKKKTKWLVGLEVPYEEEDQIQHMEAEDGGYENATGLDNDIEMGPIVESSLSTT